MTQTKTYIENLAARMRSAGKDNWAYNDMQDLCEQAGIREQWLITDTRQQEENITMIAARMLGVEIRHYVDRDMRECRECGGEFEREDMQFTRDCQGIAFRLVCHKCWDKVMAHGYDGQYYDERDECLDEDY